MWSDRETEHDYLGFTSYVSVLANVCTISDLAPLTLGIFGSWGSGKTSLMRMLKSRIEANGDQDGVKTLWFNAWRYEGREEAQSALVHAILARLAEDKTLWEDTKDVADRLMKGASILKLAKFIGKTAMTMTPNVGEFIDCFKEESQKIAETMEQFDKDFNECLERMKVKHIVVFIDDLDRCSATKVIETFETIKLFLNTPRCTFVIGADAAKIEDAVGEVYHVEELQRRKDYLEKIVQVPFTIPPQDVKDIACYIGMLVMGRHIETTRMTELTKARDAFYQCPGSVTDVICRWPTDNGILFNGRAATARDELNEILPYVHVLAHGLQGNPRQIKRFLNIVSLRRRLAEENKLEIQPEMLIKLTVLEYTWSEFFTELINTTDPATGHSALIGDMIAAAETQELATKSKLLNESLGKAGLLEYLLAEPKLSGEFDLNPYLFLAQTSLSRGRAVTLMPVDEKARSLARAIESDDPLRTKTAAKRAAAEEPAVVASIVRILLGDLPQTQEGTIQTHILTGLSTICRSHPDQYPPVTKTLASFDAGRKEPVALAAVTLLSNASKAGVQVPDGVLEKFTKGSAIVTALATPKRRSTT